MRKRDRHALERYIRYVALLDVPPTGYTSPAVDPSPETVHWETREFEVVHQLSTGNYLVREPGT